MCIIVCNLILSDVVCIYILNVVYFNINRGFGFVTFADVSVVDKVIAMDHTLDGRAMEVTNAVSKAKAPPPIK